MAKAAPQTKSADMASVAPPPQVSTTAPGARDSESRFGATDIARRKKLADITQDDLVRILTIKNVVQENADRFTDGFFDFLQQFEEAAQLFKNRTALEQARKLKREHLIAMVEGRCDAAYAEQRARLGAVYSSVGLDVKAFLGGFQTLMRLIGFEVMKRFKSKPMVGHEAFASLQKLAFFDLAIIVDILVEERERTIFAQQEAIRELSTPVIQVRDRLLILPIIGLIDSDRAMQVTESLLHAIRANRAKVVVMDVTGVAAVDSKVANHLMQTVAAARLMGASVIVTGLSADVAQSLVALGVDLGRINTIGDLQGGLEEAERQLGYKVVMLNDASA